MMHPETMAWGMGAAMADAIMSAGRNVAHARNARALHAWSDALANAQGDADDMAAVAVAAINAMVADLEEENAVLRRALRQRDDALRNLRQ